MLSGLEKALLAVLLLVLMTGMGATLTRRDFSEIARRPRGVLIGLASQYGWMPLLAFVLARALGLDDAFAVGLLIVGCTPGGTTSNLFTYYSRADVSLSISMTVVSTLCAFVMMPLLLGLYIGQLGDGTIEIPYGNIVVTLVLVLVPVGLGMWIKSRSARAAAITERVGSVAGIGVLALLIISGLVKNVGLLLQTTASMYVAAIGLGVAGMALGYLAARVLGLGRPQRRAVALETGIQNSPLALGIIVASFPDALHERMMWLPLLYALLVLLSASVVTLYFASTSRPPAHAEGAGSRG